MAESEFDVFRTHLAKYLKQNPSRARLFKKTVAEEFLTLTRSSDREDYLSRKISELSARGNRGLTAKTFDNLSRGGASAEHAIDLYYLSIRLNEFRPARAKIENALFKDKNFFQSIEWPIDTLGGKPLIRESGSGEHASDRAEVASTTQSSSSLSKPQDVDRHHGWRQVKAQSDARLRQLSERPFYGRHAQLDILDSFIEERKKGLLLVQAPSGSGKSVLLAKWLHARREAGDHIASHFVSGMFSRTTSPENARKNLLYQIQDACAPLQTSNHPSQSLYDSISGERLQEGRLIVILDAIDEAEPEIGGHPFYSFVEQGLADGVFVIVSYRSESLKDGQKYPRGWDQLDGDLVSKLIFADIDRATLGSWIDGELPLLDSSLRCKISETLYKKDIRLPLLLAFIIDDLKNIDPTFPEGEWINIVDKVSPSLSAYVDCELGRMAQNAPEHWDQMHTVFCIFCAATTPLPIKELNRILPEPPNWNNIENIYSRWIQVRNDRYSFSHPKIGDAFRSSLKSERHGLGSFKGEGSVIDQANHLIMDWMSDGTYNNLLFFSCMKSGHCVKALPYYLLRMNKVWAAIRITQSRRYTSILRHYGIAQYARVILIDGKYQVVAANERISCDETSFISLISILIAKMPFLRWIVIKYKRREIPEGVNFFYDIHYDIGL